jgi:ABC-type antimicrobial peptide transport system permease subunit
MGTSGEWWMASWMWARSDVRRRWISLVLLGVLAGLSGGIAVAVLDGANRSSTALDRLRDDALASDAIVFATEAGLTDPDWTPLLQSPAVERIGIWSLTWGSIDGGPLGGPLFAPVDDVWTTSMDRPIVVSGRRADPNAADEVMIDETAERLGYFHLGQSFDFRAMGDIGDFATGQATGSTTTLHVVGVVKYPPQFLFATDGTMIMSPAFVRENAGKASVFENAFVDLADTPGAIDELRRAANEVGPGVPVLDENAVVRRVETTTGVEQTVLLMLAAVVTFAGTILVGQAVLRSAVGIGTDATALSSIGLTRREVIATAMLPHLVTSLIAVVTTVGVGVGATRWMPVGLARQIDPHPGVHANPLLVLIGAVAVVAVVVATAWAAAVSATRHDTGRVTVRIHFTNARPVSLRTGLAIGNGRTGRGSSPLAPALLGATAAVIGVVGTLTLRDGLDHALAHPELAGVMWDIDVASDDSANVLDRQLMDEVFAVDGIARVALIARHGDEIDGTGVALFAGDPADGSAPIEATLLSGRLASADDEITLGPSTAEALDVSIGDSVVSATSGSLQVVGLALFPSDVHSAFDEGGWVTWPVMEQLTVRLAGEGPPDRVIAIRLDEPADADAVTAAVQSVIGDRVATVNEVSLPPELVNLQLAEQLPTALAVFLALLGVAAVGHALHSSVSRQRHTLAVLRAIGSTRVWLRIAIAACATALGAVAVIIGSPIGVALGRAGWRVITERVPLGFVDPSWLVVVAFVAPAVVMAVNALAVLPGRRAAARAPADDLRTE